MTRTTFVPFVLTNGTDDFGIAPLLVRQAHRLALLNWVPFPYLGPLVPRGLLGPCLDLIRRSTRGRLVVRQQQSFSVTANVPVAPLAERGFRIQQDSTFVVDTTATLEDLWAGLDSGCRRRLRKAEKEAVTIQESADHGVLESVVDAAFESRGIRSGYHGALDPALSEAELVTRRVVAVQSGAQLGSMYSLSHRGAALIWQGGVFPQHRASNAGTVLYWDAITWAQRIGARTLDLVGLPDDGIRRFKSQFGGKLVTYSVAQRESRLMSLSGQTALSRSREQRPHQAPTPLTSMRTRSTVEVS